MTVLALGVLGTALLVLPGFGLRTITRRPKADPLDELELAIVTMVAALAVVGIALVGFRQFSATRMAVPMGLLALIGIPRAAIWAWPVIRRPQPYVVLALTAPWVWMARKPGNAPSGLLQWYYWNLGESVSKVHGIPTYVSEYGRNIRWLPDYLIFNILSETYHGASRFGTDAQQLAAFRIPAVLLGSVAVYGVARLWLRATPALAGTGLIVATQLFGDKFNAYKPESYAIVLGLVAVRLGIVALRKRDTPLMLFVGVIVGLNLGVHAIAAVVMAMLLAAAILAELLLTRDLRRWKTVGALGLAGVIALGLTVGTGLALQGRALVISDAGHPEMLKGGRDPTLLFLTRNAGKFGPLETPPLADELSTNLQEPWRGFNIATLWGALCAIATTTAIVIGLGTGSRALRKAVLAMLIFSALLAVSAAYFGLSYDTFVPRHTGLSRFVQYAPLVAAMLVAIGIEGIALRLESASSDGRIRFVKVGLGAAAVAGAGAIAVALTVHRYENYQAVPPDARAVLDQLANREKPGDALPEQRRHPRPARVLDRHRGPTRRPSGPDREAGLRHTRDAVDRRHAEVLYRHRCGRPPRPARRELDRGRPAPVRPRRERELRDHPARMDGPRVRRGAPGGRAHLAPPRGHAPLAALHGASQGPRSRDRDPARPGRHGEFGCVVVLPKPPQARAEPAVGGGELSGRSARAGGNSSAKRLGPVHEAVRRDPPVGRDLRTPARPAHDGPRGREPRPDAVWSGRRAVASSAPMTTSSPCRWTIRSKLLVSPRALDAYVPAGGDGFVCRAGAHGPAESSRVRSPRRRPVPRSSRLRTM